MNDRFYAFDVSTWVAIAVRAPDAAWNGSHYIGSVLESVDESQARMLGIDYRLVHEGQFCAIAAGSREAALRVHAALKPKWLASAEAAHALTRARPDQHRFRRRYRWHASAGLGAVGTRIDALDEPCAAAWSAGLLTIRASTGRDAELTAEASAIFDVPAEHVSVVSANTPADQACYDAAIDAAIVARALQRPIRIWPVRVSVADAVLSVELAAKLDDDGRPRAWKMEPRQPDVLRPSAAFVIMAGRTQEVRRQSAPCVNHQPVDYAPRHAVEGSLAAVPLDYAVDSGASLAASLFAQESFADELAEEAGKDPVQWRLECLQDSAGRALMERVAAAAHWRPGVRGQGAGKAAQGSGVRRGQGFACAQVLDQSCDPPKPAWAAWVVDISVDQSSGLLSVDRMTVGHHLDELVVADAGDVRWRRELAQTAQSLLTHMHDRWVSPASVASTLRRGASAVVTSPGVGLTEGARSHPALPGPLSTSDALTLPAAAAVANAIYDAVGIRLRNVPLIWESTGTPLRLAASDGVASPAPIHISPKARSRRGWGMPLAVLGSVAGAAMALLPWRPSIAPVVPDLSVYSAAAIERGRLIAAASDCAVCHTGPSGAANAGGLPMDTPFGTIYSTNITPHRETGIGIWSFAAFDRAMRQGISRDGRHLYPAFPYTSFAKFSEEDMQALYAYLQSQPAVNSAPPTTRLSFPYGVRPAMAGWNLLFHRNAQYRYDDSQSPMWNRGAYLVQGAGHCSACHSPRNMLGAEKTGQHYLAGGLVDGWDAPALNGTAATAVPWTEQDLFQYLRRGFSERHGVAAGPMAPVVASLGELPDSDIQAMAIYLVSLGKGAGSSARMPQKDAELPATMTELAMSALPLAGRNIYEGACAVCHDASREGVLFGVRPSLPLNTNVTADKPDNLIRIVLEGIQKPADSALGYMPAFADVLNDSQIVELIAFLRGKYAPQRPPWEGLKETVRHVRAESERHMHAPHTHGSVERTISEIAR